MAQITEFAQALWGLVAIGLMHPAAAWVLGGFGGGYAIGVAKNRTAIVEIGRGIIIGVAVWAVIAGLQAVIASGGTS